VIRRGESPGSPAFPYGAGWSGTAVTISFMSTQLTRTLPNWITFPQNLRDAIPAFEPCAGRALRLDGIDACATDSDWIGRRVEIKLRCCETGKLDGVFAVQLSLNISAAEALAEVLRTAAEQARQSSR
jgi:hypothetical protein